MMRAQSRTVRVSGPTLSQEKLSGITPLRLTRVCVGFSPTVPHAAAGRRIEPPVSDPSAAKVNRDATAAPDPLEEPPVM